MDRLRRLRSLGYRDYDAYLHSPEWRAKRAHYRASDLPQACMCGEEQIQLHHKTYERVGDERLTDLVPLCARCHAMIHTLERRGEIELDFHGFEDAQRAAAYAVQQAPRLAAARVDRDPEVRNGDWCAHRAALERDIRALLCRHGVDPARDKDMGVVIRRLDAIERKLIAKLAAQPS